MDNIDERCIESALYIIETGATVRACAKHFGVSKSTVHNDVTQRLRRLNGELFGAVARVLQVNREQRHIRGGIATREKYRRLRVLDSEKEFRTQIMAIPTDKS